VVTQSGKVDRVDPATGEVVARVAVGRVTYDLAFAFGSIWVTNREGRTVQRIDPNRNAVVKTLRFPGQKPSGIVAAGGAIWVGDDYGSEVPARPAHVPLDEGANTPARLFVARCGRPDRLGFEHPLELRHPNRRPTPCRHPHRQGRPEPGQP
jgi:DNA-binding beta-propeller fold protein YncE